MKNTLKKTVSNIILKFIKKIKPVKKVKKMGKERVSIYNIAKEAGVSPATVSRVLTGNARVSVEKKEKVEAIIKKYDFRPNAMAQSLSNTKSKLIGFLTPDIRNPFFATIAVECEKAANERGYSLLLSNYLNDMTLQESHLQKMIEMRVDALIMMGGKVDELVSDEDYVEKINQITDMIPTVITGKLDGSDCYQVNIDQSNAMEEVMEYLIENGHEKIYLLGGRKEVNSTYVKRIRYRSSLRKHGIEFHPEYMMESKDYGIESGYSLMNEIFEMGVELPTAIVAINDFTAIGIMQSIREHNVKMPEDISIVSFDNSFLAATQIPRLTSMGYDYVRFGEALVETAIEAMEEQHPNKLTLIQPELAIRDSVKLLERRT